MAALIITPDNVFPVSTLDSGNYKSRDLAGVVLVPGQSVYLDVNNLWQLADATALYTMFGVVISGSGVNQPVGVITFSGIILIGATVAQGTVYVVGPGAGQISPIEDLIAGQYTNIMGYGDATNQFVMQAYNLPIVKA